MPTRMTRNQRKQAGWLVKRGMERGIAIAVVSAVSQTMRDSKRRSR